jgi:hypothetical protein
VKESYHRLGNWSNDNLNMVWDFLNGRDLNYWVAWGSIYYSLIFLLALALFMIALKPRASVEKGLTWLMASFVFVLLRVIYARWIGLTPLFWSTLIWLNLSAAITYTAYAMVTDKMVRRRARKALNIGHDSV